MNHSMDLGDRAPVLDARGPLHLSFCFPLDSGLCLCAFQPEAHLWSWTLPSPESGVSLVRCGGSLSVCLRRERKFLVPF